MKKKITLLAIIFSIMMTSLFAEEAEENENKWANFCGMGMMFSVYNMKIDGDGNRNFAGALIDLSETVVNIDNGLTFRADWGIWGETVCDDVSAFGDGNKNFIQWTSRLVSDTPLSETKKRAFRFAEH